jgi:hypothetical protein
VLGPDAIKLRSCLTLFHLAAPQEALFTAALDKAEATLGAASCRLLLENTAGAGVAARAGESTSRTSRSPPE